jgi:uncharacterized membrane protein
MDKVLKLSGHLLIIGSSIGLFTIGKWKAMVLLILYAIGIYLAYRR